ncbi:MAG: hypothetical protein ABFD89_27060 [Bryobacteraceae bacterium]
MLNFGFDEGGAGDTLLVSAQIGPYASVKRLTRHWQDTLRRAGVTAFHSKDYNRRNAGVFVGLSRSKRKRLLHELSQLIHKYMSLGVTTGIDVSLYKNQTDHVYRSEWGAAYSFAALMALGAGYCYLNYAGVHDEGMNVMLAQGHRNLGQAKCLMLLLIDQRRSLKLKSVDDGIMKDHPILQAADMLAYGEWQRIRGGDLEIYHALNNTSWNQHYRTEFLECDLPLIRMAALGYEATMAKMWEVTKRSQRVERIAGGLESPAGLGTPRSLDCSGGANH